MTGEARPCAGWYGKLPTLGDFASRRLDAAFVGRWDAWLARELAALRAARPEWLADYLQSPSWRFVAAPGATGTVGDGWWAGVLMPSVDRVGRYFPLTLACAMPAPPGDEGAIEALLAWLERVDDTAADALHNEWDAERLDGALQQLPLPPMARAAFPPVDDGDPRAVRRALAAAIADAVWDRSTASLDGYTWWLPHAGGRTSAQRPASLRGLPSGAAFAELFTPAGGRGAAA